jgi:hypothetical protein
VYPVDRRPIDLLPALRPDRVAWNKGRFLGPKRPLLPRNVRSIRIRLEMASNARELGVGLEGALALTGRIDL